MKQFPYLSSSPHFTSIFTFIFILLVTNASANFILSIDHPVPYVGQTSNIQLNIKTSTSISILEIYISKQFTIDTVPECSVNSVSINCNRVIPQTGTQQIIKYPAISLQSSNQYSVSFSATNPVYSDNFLVRAANSGGAVPSFFSTNGQVSVLHTDIGCKMSSSSEIVGKSSVVTFMLGLKTLPPGSVGSISFRTQIQTTFPNIFDPVPTCFIGSTQYGCSLSEIFGDQVLTISGSPVGKNPDNSDVSLSISTLKNPPYNSTFEIITIEIQDQLSRSVQKCVIEQNKPTKLQQSTFFVMNGWQEMVGSVSNNVEILLTPFFTPLPDLTVLLVFPKQLIITPKSPVIVDSDYTNPSVSAQMNFLLLQSIPYQQGMLKIGAKINNPISKIPLTLTAYILFDKTYFRQNKALPSSQLLLQTQSLVLSLTTTNPQTLVATRLKITMTSPIFIQSSIKIKITIEEGELICDQLNLLSNLPAPGSINCNQQQLILLIGSLSISAESENWIEVAYRSQQSVKQNELEVFVTDSDDYQIMSGKKSIDVGISSPDFIITSQNSTFTANTNFIIEEQNVVSLAQQIKRKVHIIPPANVTFTQEFGVVPVGSQTTILGQQLSFSTNKLILTVAGVISIKLTNLKNPSYYQFSKQWNINAFDLEENPSSVSKATHSPQYSSVISSIAVVEHSDSTIQKNNNIRLRIQPLLEYDLTDNAPKITVEFIGSSIINLGEQCPDCTLLTSTKFQFPAYAVSMSPVVEVKNNDDPLNNQVKFRIVLNNFLYQTGEVSYQLEPIQYTFVSEFEGIYEEIGSLSIILTTNLGKPVSVTYSGEQVIFPFNSTCQNCDDKQLTITGIVGFFTKTNIVVEGKSDGILYAKGIIPISYTCAETPGCQICEYVNNTMECSKCFPENLSKNFLLFDNLCYTKCPARTYKNGVICSQCPKLCYKCEPSSQEQVGIICLECQTSYFVYGQTCVKDCPVGFTKNATHCIERPIVCPKNCVDCPQDNICLKCDSGYLLLQNLCYSQCPQGYIINDDNPGICELFIPPQEIDYFPFAFLITSMIALVVLIIIKCFERRSMIMGNLTSIISFLQIGPIIMVLAYTFTSINNEPDRWTPESVLVIQALLFVAILTKIVLNLAFLTYFLVKIAPQQNFQKYIEARSKRTLYIILLVFSSVFSFQIMRMLYSRLLGLQIFYGRFNTILIFKPINFFSLAYTIPSGCLIAMAVINIMMQDGYKTAIFYSSIEVIIIEAIILISCLIQACKADPEYFDYQVYRIGNQFQQNQTPSKIDISYQQQNGGSMSRINGPDYAQGSQYTKLGSKMLQSDYWRRKQYRPTISQGDQPESYEEDYQIQQQRQQNNVNRSPSRSIFRRKILKQWESINKNMNKNAPNIYRKRQTPNNPATSTSRFVARVRQERQIQRRNSKPKRSSSLTKIEVRSPLFTNITNKSLLKKHFYEIIERQGQSDKQSMKIAKQSQPSLNNQIFQEVSEVNTIAENQVDNKYHGEIQIANEYFDRIGDNQISQIKQENSEGSIQKSLLGLKTNFKINRYDEFDNDNGSQEGDQYQYQISRKQQGNRDPSERISEFVPKRKRIKGKHVNRQTEAVYLQRLMSSQAARKPKNRKLDDF